MLDGAPAATLPQAATCSAGGGEEGQAVLAFSLQLGVGLQYYKRNSHKHFTPACVVPSTVPLAEEFLPQGDSEYPLAIKQSATWNEAIQQNIFHTACKYINTFKTYVWPECIVNPAGLLQSTVEYLLCTPEGHAEKSALSLTMETCLCLGAFVEKDFETAAHYWTKARSTAAHLSQKVEYSLAMALTALAYYAELCEDNKERSKHYYEQALWICFQLGAYNSDACIRSLCSIARLLNKTQVIMSIQEEVRKCKQYPYYSIASECTSLAKLLPFNAKDLKKINTCWATLNNLSLDITVLKTNAKNDVVEYSSKIIDQLQSVEENLYYHPFTTWLTMNLKVVLYALEADYLWALNIRDVALKRAIKFLEETQKPEFAQLLLTSLGIVGAENVLNIFFQMNECNLLETQIKCLKVSEDKYPRLKLVLLSYQGLFYQRRIEILKDQMEQLTNSHAPSSASPPSVTTIVEQPRFTRGSSAYQQEEEAEQAEQVTINTNDVAIYADYAPTYNPSRAEEQQPQQDEELVSYRSAKGTLVYPVVSPSVEELLYQTEATTYAKMNLQNYHQSLPLVPQNDETSYTYVPLSEAQQSPIPEAEACEPASSPNCDQPRQKRQRTRHRSGRSLIFPDPARLNGKRTKSMPTMVPYKHATKMRPEQDNGGNSEQRRIIEAEELLQGQDEDEPNSNFLQRIEEEEEEQEKRYVQMFLQAQQNEAQIEQFMANDCNECKDIGCSCGHTAALLPLVALHATTTASTASGPQEGTEDKVDVVVDQELGMELELAIGLAVGSDDGGEVEEGDEGLGEEEDVLGPIEDMELTADVIRSVEAIENIENLDDIDTIWNIASVDSETDLTPPSMSF